MKICLISEYFYPDSAGGTPMVLSHLTRYLQDTAPDIQFDVITSTNLYRGEANSLVRFENWRGIRIFRLQTPKSNRPSTLLRLLAGAAFSFATLLKLLRRSRPDLLFIVTNPPTLPLAAQIYSRLKGVPYVYLVHDLYPDLAVALGVLPREHPIARAFHHAQRGWLHSARRVVVLGRCMRDYLATNYGLPADKIEVITNWSDANAIQPRDKNTEFRQNNGLSGFVVLYAGGFGQYQNFDCILDAAKLLGPDAGVTWVFVGDGARKNDIAARIDREKLDNVRLLPFVPDAEFADLLASADASLVTLEAGAEGLGVPSKFYNILASGRPTVALVSPSCEVARVLQEADCGVRVEQGNAKALAQTICDLSNAPTEVERLGGNARRVFEQKYTLPQIAAHFHQVFQEVSAGR
ncbi:hypothetical protein IAD21_00394 [Abditibacteriota bacterium]|nr:hypothetical protein IAD21_00394 [Abditibacteriota bacterium]